MLTIKKLKFNAVLIQADSVEDLAKTFMRFQEYYESPHFKNQIFTIGQLKAWYSQTYGADTYIKDWSGFNFPSTVLQPFRDGLFDPLTTEEQELLSLFRYRYDSFYVIGANDEETIRHELAHALFNYDNQYKFKINHLCKMYSKELKPIKKYLLDKGYHPEVINDEIQAYVTDNDNDFIIQHLDAKVIKLFNDTYKDYA
ncbi:ABC transporter ATP-binding protein [bacterium]|nr:ABC transporter ATP-binding protein [bacterium]